MKCIVCNEEKAWGFFSCASNESLKVGFCECCVEFIPHTLVKYVCDLWDEIDNVKEDMGNRK
jgi:hypothetical protein